MHGTTTRYNVPYTKKIIYTGEFNSYDCYQRNTKRDSKWDEHYSTYLFDINVKCKDRLNIEIIHSEEKVCAGLLKLLLLAPNGRVLHSIKRTQDEQFHKMYTYNKSKTNVSINFNAAHGKYTIIYWAIAGEGHYHTINISSYNKRKSVSKCDIRKPK
jgi:hypothetical protein